MLFNLVKYFVTDEVLTAGEEPEFDTGFT